MVEKKSFRVVEAAGETAFAPVGAGVFCFSLVVCHSGG